MKKLNIFVLFILIITIFLGLYKYYKEEEQKNMGFLNFKSAKLEISSNKKTHKFNVKVADNKSTRAYGLMHVKELEENVGMFFIYDHDSVISIWMKNTYIPLDILYIDSSNKIRNIRKNATPLSTNNMSSIVPVKYVLEINGGLVDKLGIKEGDRISYQMN